MTEKLVVIAEDDAPSRLLLSEFLKSRGYQVGAAVDGLAALKLIRERTPDMVITDVNMPEMNGLELIRRLRSHHRTSRIPTILLSALTAPTQVLAGYAEGADDYVAKPVDLEVLGAKIQALLQRSEGQAPAEGAGHVVVFLHARGGAGATTVITNLACLLEPLSVTGVCVLDLNLAFGDAARQLGAKPRLALADLSLQPPELLDDKVFSKFVHECAPGIHLVVATERADHAELVTLPAVQTAITRLRERFQFVLVDAPAVAYGQHTLAALETAALVCVVTATDEGSLASAAQLLKLLNRSGISSRRQVVILNSRVADGADGNPADLLGRPVDVRVAHSTRFPQAIAAGQALAATDPDAEAVETLRELAAGLADRISRAGAASPAR